MTTLTYPIQGNVPSGSHYAGVSMAEPGGALRPTGRSEPLGTSLVGFFVAKGYTAAYPMGGGAVIPAGGGTAVSPITFHWGGLLPSA